MNARLEKMLTIARKAGDLIMQIYQNDRTVIRKKEDRSPLTEADLAAHRIIVEALAQLEPKLPVLSEESAHIAFEERRLWSNYWLIDPLDGTREFIKRNGEFTVNIALIESGITTCGVVHAPATGISYFGDRHTGAYKREANGDTIAIQVAKQCQQPPRIVGSRSHPSEQLQGFLNRLGPHQMLSMGSSLKLCMVAEGRADVYPRLGLTSEWDTAAAQAVVEAAGGYVTDLEGQPLRYNQKASVLNPYFLVFGDTTANWSSYIDVSQVQV